MKLRAARDDSGSTALEYILVLSLVGLLVLALTGSSVASRSDATITQAVCRLFAGPGGAGACGTGAAGSPPSGAPADPCIRSSTGAEVAVELNVFFVDLGDGTGFTIEELSNGTHRVVWTDEGSLGATAALVQGEATVRVGDQRVGLGGKVAADVALGQNDIDARIFASQDEAVDYVVQRALDEGTERLPHGPREVVQAGRGLVDWVTGNERDDGQLQRETGETSLRVGGEASGTVGPLSGELTAAAEGAVRVTQNADGSRSVSLVLSSEGSAGLGVPLVTELEGAAGGEYELRFTVDANGDLTKLRVGVVTEGGFGVTGIQGRENVSASLREARRSLTGSQSDRTVFFYELAVNDPAVRDAAVRFLEQAPRAGVDLAQGDSAALQAAAADLWSGAGPASTISVREYRDSEGGAGLAAKLRVLDIGGGAGADVTISSSQLQSAVYWDTTNGGWVRDTACLGP